VPHSSPKHVMGDPEEPISTREKASWFVELVAPTIAEKALSTSWPIQKCGIANRPWGGAIGSVRGTVGPERYRLCSGELLVGRSPTSRNRARWGPPTSRANRA
jgi:hypothetical protein